MKFCPTCRYYLYLDTSAGTFKRVCRMCGFQEENKDSGIIFETNLKERTSDGYKVLMNEFTRFDPTLPHDTNIKCPNGECATNTGDTKRDVVYLKYDSVNLKYLYICNVCETQWKSKD